MDNPEHLYTEHEISELVSGAGPFAAAMRASRMPMVITDPRKADNPIIFVNDAFARLTGYSREETLGKNCRFLQGPGTNADDVSRLKRAIAERTSIELDLLNYKRDGSIFWNRLLVSPVFDGEELMYFFASQHDVTRERAINAIKNQEDYQLELERRIADLIASEERLNFTLKAGGLGTWTLDLPAQKLSCSALCKDNFGRSPTDKFDYEELKSSIHPGDFDRWQDAVMSALSSDGNLQVEYRINRPDGTLSWVEVRAETKFSADGQPILMNGISMDITARKAVEAEKAVIAQEMGHRIKNMMATVQSIVNQSMRGDFDVTTMRNNITSRLDALGRSHDVLRGRDFLSANIRAVIERAIEPFDAGKRFVISGPDFLLSHQGSNTLALSLHELATNAAKYGALSTSEGRVIIDWRIDGDEFHFAWVESGGPAVSPPKKSGFGTRLIRMLGLGLTGKASIDYNVTGVVFTASTNLASLSEI
ncbi:PAS domain-containing protein [uncultured Agrobacterium sp.]|uniref:PAS domain-containing protein n=1 Tax=uncultured Agrobacterium sp. TaxID=157277 RepID=UPI0025DF8A36|nr:PAS domain-containing protein [uncultured Agrobacterium sp.]